jgi:hypothetical protein
MRAWNFKYTKEIESVAYVGEKGHKAQLRTTPQKLFVARAIIHSRPRGLFGVIVFAAWLEMEPIYTESRILGWEDVRIWTLW